MHHSLYILEEIQSQNTLVAVLFIGDVGQLSAIPVMRSGGRHFAKTTDSWRSILFSAAGRGSNEPCRRSAWLLYARLHVRVEKLAPATL